MTEYIDENHHPKQQCYDVEINCIERFFLADYITCHKSGGAQESGDDAWKPLPQHKDVGEEQYCDAKDEFPVQRDSKK